MREEELEVIAEEALEAITFEVLAGVWLLLEVSKSSIEDIVGRAPLMLICSLLVIAIFVIMFQLNNEETETERGMIDVPILAMLLAGVGKARTGIAVAAHEHTCSPADLAPRPFSTPQASRTQPSADLPTASIVAGLHRQARSSLGHPLELAAS